MDKLLTKEVVEKVRTGDVLTDLELSYAIKFYGDLDKMLLILGPEFSHARREVDRTHDALQYFAEARKRG